MGTRFLAGSAVFASSLALVGCGLIEGQEATAAMAAGAAQGRATPNSPKWANVELDNPVKLAVQQGEDPKSAAEAAVAKITAALR